MSTSSYLDHSSENHHQSPSTFPQRVQHDRKSGTERPYNTNNDPDGETSDAIHSGGSKQRKRYDHHEHQRLHRSIRNATQRQFRMKRTMITDDHAANLNALLRPEGSMSSMSVSPSSDPSVNGISFFSISKFAT